MSSQISRKRRAKPTMTQESVKRLGHGWANKMCAFLRAWQDQDPKVHQSKPNLSGKSCNHQPPRLRRPGCFHQGFIGKTKNAVDLFLEGCYQQMVPEFEILNETSKYISKHSNYKSILSKYKSILSKYKSTISKYKILLQSTKANFQMTKVYFQSTHVYLQSMRM